MGLQMSNQILKYSYTEAANVCTIRLCFGIQTAREKGLKVLQKKNHNIAFSYHFHGF